MSRCPWSFWEATDESALFFAFFCFTQCEVNTWLDTLSKQPKETSEISLCNLSNYLPNFFFCSLKKGTRCSVFRTKGVALLPLHKQTWFCAVEGTAMWEGVYGQRRSLLGCQLLAWLIELSTLLLTGSLVASLYACPPLLCSFWRRLLCSTVCVIRRNGICYCL